MWSSLRNRLEPSKLKSYAGLRLVKSVESIYVVIRFGWKRIDVQEEQEWNQKNLNKGSPRSR